MVARGFTQKPGIDYEETFAPVAKFTSLRCLLSVAASKDMEIDQVDVETAFLIPKLTEEVYVIIPDGFGSDTGKYAKLNKSLYGLKQAPRVWNNEINQFLLSIGFKPNPHDPCIYSGSYESLRR